MKTTFDPIQLLYNRLNGSDLDAAMTGSFYKMVRPIGSTLEDGVINALPITADQFQQSVCNVNIYVPDVRVNLAGTKQTMPDTARLGALASLAMNTLAEHYDQTVSFVLVSQQTFAEPETAHHYLNLRIEFRFSINP